MSPPFSEDAFFGVFSAYNQAVWPLQVAFVVLAVAMVDLAWRGRRWATRAVPLGLAFLWAWMGIVYHWSFFNEINPAARAFGAAFVAQAVAFVWLGLRRGGLPFAPARDGFGAAGAALVGYALVVYPLLGLALGHTFPANPTFGLPCPTTIFTIGMLMWARPGVPWLLLVVPALWSVIGFSAVRYFGVVEDAMLPVAGVLGGAAIAWRNRRAAASSALPQANSD